MAKTKTTKRPANRARPKGTVTMLDQDAVLRADRRALQQRLRIQREIIRLGNQLARVTRQADYKLADLGGRLLERARRAQQDDAAQDFVRDTSVMDRQPVIGD